MARASLGGSSYLWDSLQAHLPTTKVDLSSRPWRWLQTACQPSGLSTWLESQGLFYQCGTRMAACLQGLLNLGAWSKPALEGNPQGTAKLREHFP